jgi:hypothetical protein
MEPLTAIGLAANIIQFVDLGHKILANAKEIWDSSSGLTRDDQRTTDMATEMSMLSSKLETLRNEPGDADNEALFKVASECRKLSNEVLELLKKSSAKTPGSKREALQSSVRRKRYTPKLRELERKLQECLSHLHLHLAYASRCGRCF